MEIEQMLEVENKYNLLEKEMDGFQYWIYSRYEVWYRCIVPAKTGNPCETPIAMERGNKMLTLLGDAFSLTKCALCKGTIPKKMYDVCFMNHERRQRIGNYYECIYTEFMTEFFPNSFTVERTYRHRHLQPVKTSNLIYIDGVEVRSNLYSWFKRKWKTEDYRRKKQILLESLDEPMEFLGSLYGVEINVDEICEIILRFYYIYKIKVIYFSKLLRKYRPKVIVQVVGYNMDCMIVNELTSESSIQTVELEHAAIGTEHLAYSFYNAGKKNQIRQFAKNLFAFSDYFLQGTKLPLTKVWSVGYPFLDRMKEKYPPEKGRDSSCTILFLSQLKYGRELSEIAVKCRRILENVRIVYKLHPKEFTVWREIYPKLATEGIEVLDTLERNIYQCFAIADAQVGGYTTAIYEGLAYELPTFILDYEEIGDARKLCDDETAYLFKNAEELASMIKNGMLNRRMHVNIWGGDAVNASVQCLKNLLYTEE